MEKENLNNYTEQEEVIISWAVETNKLDIIKELFKKDNSFNEVLLDNSIHAKNIKLVKFFVENGAIVNNKKIKPSKRNNKSWSSYAQPTHLFWALYNGNLDIIDYLIENGADIKHDNYRDLGACQFKLDVLKHLINKKYIEDMDNKEIYNILSLAISNNNIEMIDYLANRLDINKYTKYFKKYMKNQKIDILDKKVKDIYNYLESKNINIDEATLFYISALHWVYNENKE
jgi:ankyrin repeat protein